MNYRKFIPLFTLVCILLVTSCAKTESENYNAQVEASFKAWMEIYAPEAVLQPSGIYIIKSSNPATSDQTPQDGQWVRLNYTGRLINGEIYATRYKDTAQLLGIYSRFAHYVPEYFELQKNSIYVPEGAYYALKEMKPGEQWRVFIPPKLAEYGTFLTSFPTGFGNTSIYSGAPLIMDLSIAEIIPDPTEYEENEVETFARDQWGLNSSNTIEPFLFYERIDSVPGSGRIGEDSTIYFYYAISFLDGFIFDTNIKQVAIENDIVVDATDEDGNSNEDKYEPLEYVPSSGEMISAVEKAITERMHYNDSARLVFTSEFGYGEYGNSSGSTVIQPYNPLIFYIKILAHSGIKQNPYTISQVLEITQNETDKWVKGYIVGCVEGTNKATQSRFEAPFTNKTNLLLAESANETDPAKCIAIKLEYQTLVNLNLADNEDVLQKTLTIEGDIEPFLGDMGLINVNSDYTLK